MDPMETIGAARQMRLRYAKTSLRELYEGSKSALNEMMRTLQYSPDAKPAPNIPLASTSGRVSGEFWSERRGRTSCDYYSSETLYNLTDEHHIQKFWELPQSECLEDIVNVDDNHSVTTGFYCGKQADERSSWLSLSHKLGVNHGLAAQFESDLKGGSNFFVHSTHKLFQDSTLSSNLCSGSSGNSTAEVELQIEKKRGKQEEPVFNVLGSIMTDLSSGGKLLRAQVRNVFWDVAYLNSIIFNPSGGRVRRSMVTIPLSKSGFVSCSRENSCGRQMLFINAVQNLYEQVVIGASFTSNSNQEHCMSLEAKHQGLGNLVVKLGDLHQGLPKLDVAASLATGQSNLLLTYRNSSSEGRASGLEWRHDISPDKFYSIRAGVKDWVCTISTEVRFPL